MKEPACCLNPPSQKLELLHERGLAISKHPKASTGQSPDSHQSHQSYLLSVMFTPPLTAVSKICRILKSFRLSESTVSEDEDSVGVEVQSVSLDGCNTFCGKTKSL